LLKPAYKGLLPEIKEQIIDMALNGSNIRDTARMLGISTDTVLKNSKKKIVTQQCELSSAGFAELGRSNGGDLSR
jgi:transposase-like protein